MITTLFEQRLTEEQCSQVLEWFPELHYDATPGTEGFYDPDTGRFHRDYWFLNDGGDVEDKETIQLCILEKNRWMVDVIYACLHCRNSWVSAYIRTPQDRHQPYVPQSLSCDVCKQPAQVTYTFEYFERRSSSEAAL
jgi:hypothetical protein